MPYKKTKKRRGRAGETVDRTPQHLPRKNTSRWTTARRTNRMPKELALTTRRVTIHAPGKDFEAKVIKSREAPGTWELACNPGFEHSRAQLTEESRFQLLP